MFQLSGNRLIFVCRNGVAVPAVLIAALVPLPFALKAQRHKRLQTYMSRSARTGLQAGA